MRCLFAHTHFEAERTEVTLALTVYWKKQIEMMCTTCWKSCLTKWEIIHVAKMKNLGKTTSFTYCTLTLTTCCKDSKQFPVSFHIPGLSERSLLKGVFETTPPGKESECEPSQQPGSCSCGILPLLTGEKWPFWFITEIFPWFQCVKWGMCPGAS